MELIPSALVPRCCTEVSPQMWHSLCLWAVSRQREEGLWHSFHPTVCRLGVYIPWHELLLRGILLQWVNLAVVSKLSIKTVNTPRLRPVQTHFLPTELPWLNISEWLADVQSLPILPKALNNLSDLIFKMFTVSAGSCTVQQQHQGECTYSELCPKCRERLTEPHESSFQPEHGATGTSETWLEVICRLLIYKDRECFDRTGTGLQEKTQTDSSVTAGRGRCCSVPKWASLCLSRPQETHSQIRQPPKHRIHFPRGKEENLKHSGTALGHPSVFEMVRVGKRPRWKATWK